MPVNLFVRKTFNAKALKSEVNQYLDPKIRSLKNNKDLTNYIAREWGTAVTRFVPRSQVISGHHMQQFTVSDGRVIWRRPARKDDVDAGISKGEELAHLLYEGPIHGVFRVRAEGGTMYGGHRPQAHWDECVTPGTSDWKKFVVRITPIITDLVKRGLV